MNQYSYDVSLRVRHPEISPEEICKKLGIKARHKWVKGEQRMTSKGVLLNGVYEHNYCSFRLDHSKDVSLVDFLKECNGKLNPNKDFLNHIRSTGGAIEYFIGWYLDGNSGEVFDINLLSQLVELSIELSIDIYTK